MKPTHIKNGLPQMVDVTDKQPTKRKAVVLTQLFHIAGKMKDGKEAMVKASLTSTTVTKLLPQFIPMTHPIPFTYIGNESQHISESLLNITTTVKANWYTGMEVEGYLGGLMYALTLAAHQDTAIYTFIIKRSMLIHKSGGKSGTLVRSIGTITNILLDEQTTHKFIKVKKLEPLFLSNDPSVAAKDASYPLLITDANLYNAKGYIEIGPHIMTITYREIFDNERFLLMISPQCDTAVIRIEHQVVSLLMEEREE